MKDPEAKPVQGRVRWRRFAAMIVPTTALAGAVVFGMANGAIAASFAVSGQQFKVSASKLEGEGFKQYGGVAIEKNPEGLEDIHPVAISEIERATLENLCQSVKVPAPIIGDVVLRIEAGGGGTPARAENLMIDMSALSGDATFTDINIGRDASDLNPSAPLPGTFGQDARKVVITDLKQTAWATSAGTFTLNGLTLKLHYGSDATSYECFPDSDLS